MKESSVETTLKEKIQSLKAQLKKWKQHLREVKQYDKSSKERILEVISELESNISMHETVLNNIKAI